MHIKLPDFDLSHYIVCNSGDGKTKYIISRKKGGVEGVLFPRLKSRVSEL